LYVLRRPSVRIANPAASVMVSTYVDELRVSILVDAAAFRAVTT
jgi:hypothetical protein